MLLGDDKRFLRVAFEDEKELENVVEKNFELLFGSHAVYLPQQRIKTLGGTATVPEAIVIDLEGDNWYVVEVERATHGTWQHIAPQVSKQLAAVENEETRREIVKLALEAISRSDRLKEALQELEISEFDVHGRLSENLSSPPIVAIPIDEIPDDLEEWARTLRHQVKIWEIEKYSELETDEVLYSLPDAVAPDLDTGTELEPIPETRFEGGRKLRRLLAAKLLRPGQTLWMKYGPGGKNRQRFTATVREDGLEVDGKVYSPSYAAVACMRRAGSDRSQANGWYWWHTEDGRKIQDLYKKIPDSKE